MNNMVGIVGYGKMGQAIARGLVNLPQLSIQVTDLRAIPTDGSIAVVDLANLMATSPTVILAIKPQNLRDFSNQIQAFDRPKSQLIISILAGISIDQVRVALGGRGRVVRAMPNIAVQRLCGMTALSCQNDVMPADRDWATRLFEVVGKTRWVNEDDLDAVTGISGSGPAFLYRVAKAMVDAGVDAGLPRDIAVTCMTQTIRGVGEMVAHNPDFDALIAEVASPNGTTVAGLSVFDTQGIDRLVSIAVAAAIERSRELNALAKSR